MTRTTLTDAQLAQLPDDVVEKIRQISGGKIGEEKPKVVAGTMRFFHDGNTYQVGDYAAVNNGINAHRCEVIHVFEDDTLLVKNPVDQGVIYAEHVEDSWTSNVEEESDQEKEAAESGS